MELDKIKTISDKDALKTRSEITYLGVADSTPSIIQKYGALKLPLVIRFDAMYLAQRGSGVFEGQKDIGTGDELYNLIVTFFDYKENYLQKLFVKYGAEIKYKKETLSKDNPKLHKWLGTIKESVSSAYTNKLLRTIGFQAPIKLQQSGYIGIISYKGQNVNIEGKKFSEVFIEQTQQNSNRDTYVADFMYADRENSVEFASNEEYNNWESYELTAEFTKNVPYSERHTFLRSLANKTNGMKRGERKNIVIITDKHVYFYEATGYMNGSIAKRSGLTKKANAEIKVWSDYYGSIDTGATTPYEMAEGYESGRRRNDWDYDAPQNFLSKRRNDEVVELSSESNPIGDTWESNGDFEAEELIPGSIVYNDNDVAFKVADDGSIETLQFADRYTDSIDNTNIEKYVYNANSISRANKQGELINDYYNALSKSEWKTFYKKIAEQHYLAIARVGTVAPVVVGDKLIIAERLHTGKDAHDYVITDAYKLLTEDGDTYTLTLLQDALNKGDVNYDTQGIFSFVNRLNRLDGRNELLARYNRDNSRFDDAFDNRKQEKSGSGIYQDSQERLDGEGLSLRDKSSLQEDDELLSFADRDEANVYELMGENQRLIKENEKIKADIERLKERLEIERQVTHGNYFNENQLNAVAGHLRNIANTTYSKTELVRQLKEVYSYIAHGVEILQ